MEKICKRGAGAISVWLLALLLLCGQLFPLNASALSAGAEADAAGGRPSRYHAVGHGGRLYDADRDVA